MCMKKQSSILVLDKSLPKKIFSQIVLVFLWDNNKKYAVSYLQINRYMTAANDGQIIQLTGDEFAIKRLTELMKG